MNNIIYEIEDYGPKFFRSILILAVFFVVAEYFRIKILEDEELIRDSIAIKQLSNVTYYLIFLIGFLFFLLSMGVHWGSILAILGSLGLTIGFAMQNLLKNAFSAVYIISGKLFEIGDIVEIKKLSYYNYIKGKVIDFDLLNVYILTDDNKIHYLPNSMIQDNILVNLSKFNKFNVSGEYKNEEMHHLNNHY